MGPASLGEHVFQFHPSGHSVGEQTPKHLDAMIEDLRSSLDFLLANPDTKPEGKAAVYGAAAAIPDELLDDILRGYVDVLMKVKPA